MKIGNNAEQVAAATTTPVKAGPGETKTGATAAVATGSTPEASAKVELSSAATSLTGTDASSADFDAEKVARMTKAIEDRTFKVDHASIADKLIANAQEALTKVSH